MGGLKEKKKGFSAPPFSQGSTSAAGGPATIIGRDLRTNPIRLPPLCLSLCERLRKFRGMLLGREREIGFQGGEREAVVFVFRRASCNRDDDDVCVCIRERGSSVP